MNKTSHTEYLNLESVLIKPVSAAFRSDRIIAEQWQALNFLEKPIFRWRLTNTRILNLS